MRRPLATPGQTFFLAWMAFALALGLSPVASAQSIEALSQTQTLSDTQQDLVRDWFTERLDTVVDGGFAEASESAQALFEPFWRGEVTASFRFAAQGALAERLRRDLGKDAAPLARLTALRLCGRIATSAVLGELDEAIASELVPERSFAVTAFGDFFETASEEASPIRANRLDAALTTLSGALAKETEPTLAAALVGVLAKAGGAQSDARLRASRAMAEGLSRRFDAGVDTRMFPSWCVVLTRAIEAANRTYVEQQLRGGRVDTAFVGAVGRLCAHALVYSFESASEAINGTVSGGTDVLIDMVRRANTVFVLVSDGAGGPDNLHETLRSALKRGDLGAYADALGTVVGPGAPATGVPFNFDAVQF